MVKFFRALKAALIVLVSAAALNVYGADRISAPSFVNQANSSSLQEAGQRLNGWILAFIGVVIALCSVRPGYYFVIGDAQKGWEHSREILIGGVVSTLLGGIVFAVINAVS